MSDAAPLPKVCPFCGKAPVVQLGKKGHCQLHGEPSQGAIVRCNTGDCPARPSVERGDVFNGGEAKARSDAITAWNRRAPSAEPELRAEVAELRERVKIAEDGMAAASQALHWCAKEACTSGMSWAGKNIVGDTKSVDYVRAAVHYYEQRDAFAEAWKERLDSAVAERDAKLRIANAVVKAASRFSDCAAEFDGDLSVCHEHLDALWSALDQLSSAEIDAALGGGAVG